MNTNDDEQIMKLLKESFPGFAEKLGLIYQSDPLFREIAGEYFEVVKKMKMIYFGTGKKIPSYTDTINELQEELAEYLNGLRTDDTMTQNNEGLQTSQ
jgi:hypothetical protein